MLSCEPWGTETLSNLLPRMAGECTVKPVLETTCIKRPPALRDHCSDTTTVLKLTL